MPSKTISGHTIVVDDEGFMADVSQWNREIASAIGHEEGITLSDKHWQVIEFMQSEAKRKGEAPSIRAINKSGIVTTKELYELFPNGPAKKAAKIAGLKKPAGCV